MFHQRHAGCNRISTRSQDYRLQFRPEIDHRLQIPLEGGKLFRRGGFKPAARPSLPKNAQIALMWGWQFSMPRPLSSTCISLIDRSRPASMLRARRLVETGWPFCPAFAASRSQLTFSVSSRSLATFR